MLGKRRIFATVIITSVVFLLGSTSAWASSTVLKKEMQGSEVTSLQKDLKKLGYLSTDATGFYGDATEAAIKKLQKEYGYDPDGMAGNTTQALIDRLLAKNVDIKSTTDNNATAALKDSMEGSAVTALQNNLVKLGYLATKPTGYFGSATTAAVKKLQKKYGYEPDGIAGAGTLALINKLLSGTKVKTVASTTSKGSSSTNYKLPWSTASKIFAIGTTATVYDIATGLSFRVKRTYGHNHADTETLTAKDTATMKKIFGGSWSWDRRAVIITVGGQKIAASIAGMPHAGSEKYAANKYVSSRSGGFGRGENLDAVKGNNMSGHFDVHFYGSKTHETNRSDPQHQAMVKKAAEWAKKNL